MTDQEIEQMADKVARKVLQDIGVPIYVEPKSVIQALESSMKEESAAADFYRCRAIYSVNAGDVKSAMIWNHIADEENKHKQEFQRRLADLEFEADVAELEKVKALK